MTEFLEVYAGADDRNDRYRLLREEMARLRDGAEKPDFFDPDAVRETIRDLAADHGGRLVVVLANDFGLPLSFRPDDLPREALDDLRAAILAGKYDDEQDDLASVRRDLLDEHPGVHKAIVADLSDGAVRYHLPEGTNEETNFLTVREMVGLVDYTTNSDQADGLSNTY